MIDFRYHLVSLMSVFLALAVGIALGAGPLKEAIGDTLTGQVDQLRSEKADLRDELSARASELSQQEAAFAAVAPSLLQGVLTDRRVAIIELADVSGDVRDQVAARLGDAGATVTATVQVTDGWNDPAKVTYRQTLAGTLVDYLNPVPAQDAGTDTELAEALVQALTAAAPTDPDTLSDNSGVVLQLLTDGGLISSEGDITLPADAIVILAGPTTAGEPSTGTVTPSPSPSESADNELRDAQLAAALQIGLAAQARATGAVIAGGELADNTLIDKVRADDDAAAKLSTVESVHTLTGQISVPLALSARIAGTVGHYGPSDGTTAAMPPRVVLPPIVRAAVQTDQPADAGTPTAPSGGATP